MIGKNGLLKYIVSALIAAFAIGEAGAVSTAPINPAFKEWQRRRSDTSATGKNLVRRMLPDADFCLQILALKKDHCLVMFLVPLITVI